MTAPRDFLMNESLHEPEHDLIPNRETQEAMKELSEGNGQRFDDADALFDDLGI